MNRQPMFAVKTDERIFAMKITDNRIDGGKAFDWGLTSHDYAKYRDIYPKEFYEKIILQIHITVIVFTLRLWYSGSVI